MSVKKSRFPVDFSSQPSYRKSFFGKMKVVVSHKTLVFVDFKSGVPVGRLLGLRVAQLPQNIEQERPFVALNDDDAVVYRAAHATLLFQ